tara:strand:- start:536 stop:769 length:234 start_codon:yes stop_codon:yes gene_type:complete
MPDYIYNIGDIVKLNDNNVGLITGLTNACEYMAIDTSLKEALMQSFMNIPIYKVIINSTISYIDASNIKELLCKVGR